MKAIEIKLWCNEAHIERINKVIRKEMRNQGLSGLFFDYTIPQEKFAAEWPQTHKGTVIRYFNHSLKPIDYGINPLADLNLTPFFSVAIPKGYPAYTGFGSVGISQRFSPRNAGIVVPKFVRDIKYYVSKHTKTEAA